MKFELDKNENINIDYKITKIKESNNYIVLYLDNDEKLYVSIEAYFKHISKLPSVEPSLTSIISRFL